METYDQSFQELGGLRIELDLALVGEAVQGRTLSGQEEIQNKSEVHHFLEDREEAVLVGT